MKISTRQSRPTIPEIETELERLKSKRTRGNNIRYVIFVSLLAAALIIIATNLWFPVLRVVGSSMQQTLQSDDIVVCSSIYRQINRGDIIAFYNNDRILLKRVVGIPGDTVTIDADGVLFVNGEQQPETYVMTLSLEPCDVTFPIDVPVDSYFVLGDRRTTSMDSRNKGIGMPSEDKIIGTVLFRVWPFSNLGSVD